MIGDNHGKNSDLKYRCQVWWSIDNTKGILCNGEKDSNNEYLIITGLAPLESFQLVEVRSYP